MERMASSVSYEHRPALRNPVFIEGLPGVGNIGKLAADLMSEQLGAVRFACIYSDDLPPQVILDEDCIGDAARCELWYADIGDRDVVFLLGDFQGTTPAGQYNLSEYIFRLILPYDPSMILTLGGYGTGQLTTTPRVLGAVTHPEMKPALESAGVGFYPGEPQGGIVGAAAMFLAFGRMYGIDSACIMGETSGYIVDYRSARNVVNAVCALLGINVDTSSFQEQIDGIEAASEAIAEKAQAAKDPEDLIYIR